MLAAAVASGAAGSQSGSQLLRQPPLAAELALPLPNSGVLLGGRLLPERSGLVDLRAGGSTDEHFGKHGLRILPKGLGSYFGGEEFGDPVAVDQKGRILLVEPGEGLAAVRRLLPDGRLDRSFGSGGVARVGLGGESADTTSVAVQQDGKILLGGGSGCSEYGCTEAPAMARLTESGNLDPSFGNNGHEFLFGPSEGDERRVMGLTTGPNGEIFAVSGGYASNLTIQRLGARGKVDHSFGHRGSVIVGKSGPARAGLFTLPRIDLTPNGKVVVGGHVELLHGGDDAMVAFRYLADGRPDPSFGQNGHAVLKTSVNAFTSAVAVAPDGEVVLSGDGVGKTQRYFLIAALRPDGSLDPAVGDGGFTKVKVASESSATALVLQPKTAIAIGYTRIRAQKGRRTLLARIPLSR